MNKLGRPDLEEFLSALSGFVDKKSASPDSNYLKFLDIFCRSVGSTEGHLLRPDPSGRLESAWSFGVDEKFDADFNSSRTTEASPLDEAFSSRRVVALVEIHPGDVPRWFFQVMSRYGYKALVAVPIIGPSGVTGLLCAYYRDVCLFDQGTLDRLASVGRMLGGAETSANPPPGKAGASSKEKAASVPREAADDAGDEFARELTEHSFTKIQVFGHLIETLEKAFPGTAAVCGPVRVVSGDMVITVADAVGVPTSTVSQRLTLPSTLRQALEASKGAIALAAGQQGELKAVIKMPQASVLARSLLFQGKVQAAVVAWRAAGSGFTADEERQLGHFAAIAALALNAA